MQELWDTHRWTRIISNEAGTEVTDNIYVRGETVRVC